MKHYYISLPYATYAIGVENMRVKLTPPIVGWMYGKDIMFIKNWIKSKKGRIKLIDNEQE